MAEERIAVDLIPHEDWIRRRRDDALETAEGRGLINELVEWLLGEDSGDDD